MRIMIASDLHWPTINGVATFGRNLARGLADAGHEVVVVAPSQTGLFGEETDVNHRVVRLPSREFRAYQNLRFTLPFTGRLTDLVESFRPDIIHVQTPLGVGIAAMRVAPKCGVPLVGTNHSMSQNFIDNVPSLRPFAKPIDSMLHAYGDWFYEHCQFVTLPTQAAIDMLRPEDFHRPTMAISNGIDLSRFRPGEEPEGLRAKFGIPEGVPVVLYVGRLDAEKHLSVLMKAAHRALKEHAFHLVLVGLGVDRPHLERLAGELGISEHVTFTGRIDEADKEQIFRIASVFGMPSPAELQSISTLEAMASGLPVVAVDAGALGELCQEGRNGLRFALDDDAAMAVHIATLLEDADLATRMGAESLEIARHHDISETIARFAALYEQVAADHAAERAAFPAKRPGSGGISGGMRPWLRRLRPESPDGPGGPRPE